MWSRDGRRLFYCSFDGRIMAIDYTIRGGTFLPGAPRPWSPAPIQVTTTYINFDVHPDGKRVIANLASESSQEKTPNLHVTFVLNFFDELPRRVPL